VNTFFCGLGDLYFKPFKIRDQIGSMF
jgi:hypothetical protein